MLTHTLKWSLPAGNTVVPSRWQATLIPGTRFCVNCGRPRDEATETTEPTVAPQLVVVEHLIGPTVGVITPHAEDDTTSQAASNAGTSSTSMIPPNDSPPLPSPPEPVEQPQAAAVVAGDLGDAPRTVLGEPSAPVADASRRAVVSEVDGVPTLAALPPVVRDGVSMGLRILGGTLAVGLVLSVVVVAALTSTAGEVVAAGTLLKMIFTGAIQLAGVALFGTVSAIVEVGGITLVNGSISGLAPFWALAALVFLVVRIARRRPPRGEGDADASASVGNTAVEAGIASISSVLLLSVLMSIARVRAGSGLGDVSETGEDWLGITDDLFALELSTLPGRVILLGGLLLFALIFLVRMQDAGHLAALRSHPTAPLVGRVAAVIRDHFALAYLLLLPAGITLLAVMSARDEIPLSFGQGVLAVFTAWGPAITVAEVLSAPVRLFGVLPTLQADASGNVPSLGDSIGMESFGVQQDLSGLLSLPGYAPVVLWVFGLLTIAVVGIRWGLRQAEGWHSQWGTAWLLPLVYAGLSLPLLLLAKTSINGTYSIPFLGDGAGGFEVGLPGYTVLLMGALGFAIEAIGRIGTPWMARTMPGAAKVLERKLHIGTE